MQERDRNKSSFWLFSKTKIGKGDLYIILTKVPKSQSIYMQDSFYDKPSEFRA